MVEEYEFELMRLSLFKAVWELKTDWFKTHAIFVNVSQSEASVILQSLDSTMKRQESMWGSDNLKSKLMRDSLPTLKKKLMSIFEV
jgi:hypothetical protein